LYLNIESVLTMINNLIEVVIEKLDLDNLICYVINIL